MWEVFFFGGDDHKNVIVGELEVRGCLLTGALCWCFVFAVGIGLMTGEVDEKQ